MKTVKMFDYYEEIVPVIEPILDEAGLNVHDIGEYLDIWGNDSAYHWYVENESEDVFTKALNDYFLSAGCALDEEVVIWISW